MLQIFSTIGVGVFTLLSITAFLLASYRYIHREEVIFFAARDIIKEKYKEKLQELIDDNQSLETHLFLTRMYQLSDMLIVCNTIGCIREIATNKRELKTPETLYGMCVVASVISDRRFREIGLRLKPLGNRHCIRVISQLAAEKQRGIPRHSFGASEYFEQSIYYDLV